MKNSSEEIVNKIINEQNKPKSLRIGRKGEIARFSRMIEQYADELLSETLQELKAKVDNIYTGHTSNEIVETKEGMKEIFYELIDQCHE